MKEAKPHPDRMGLKKWFGDLEVIEASYDIRLQPSKEDIINARRGDPRECIFSRCCQRMWGSTVVVFFGTVAYVDLLDKHGERHVERFIISESGKRFINAWDNGANVIPQGFLLKAPSACATTEARNKTKRERERRVAILKGSKTGSKNKRPKRKPTGLRVSTFRNGMGMAQFPEETPPLNQ